MQPAETAPVLLSPPVGRRHTPFTAEGRIVQDPGAAGLSEPHFTVDELARILRVSTDTIRRWFRNEPGVVHLGRATPGRRVYDPLRIPRNVAERVYGQSLKPPR